ncbi:MAG: methyltransferase domain-containing protein, partial [Planctomycetota bacterium]
SFHKARIQDLRLDLEAAGAWLAEHPIRTVEDLEAFDAHCDALRTQAPLVADDSVDVIVSNCVLNLVRPEEKERLFTEMARVLRRGGRAVISDIVCDEDPTPQILADPALWSGCIAGAYREDAFLDAFAKAGFYGIEIVSRAAEPWQVIDGIEFRSVTVRAFHGKEGPCLERNQAVIYGGPWSQVQDDDGHVLKRGERTAVCDKTYRILTDRRGPYGDDVLPVPPRVEVPLDRAAPFACRDGRARSPRETKGEDYHETREGEGASSCSPGAGGCCE